MVSYIRGNDNFDSSTGVIATPYGVGSYTIGVFAASSSTIEPGTSYSGSAIISAGHYTNTTIGNTGYSDPLIVNTSSTLSGTWKTCERYVDTGNASYRRPVLLCIRIS